MCYLMKAATGEVNLTVITVVAIAAVIAFFASFLWPKLQGAIGRQAHDTATCLKYDSSGTCISSSEADWTP